MPDGEPTGVIRDIADMQQRKQERLDRKQELTGQFATLYEAFARSGDFQIARTLAQHMEGRIHLDSAPRFGISADSQEPTFNIDLSQTAQEVQEAAAQALLRTVVEIHNGKETSLDVHTSDHVEGYEKEAIVSLYTRGLSPDMISFDPSQKPTLTDLLSILGQNPGMPSAGKQRQSEIIPMEAANRPLLVFVVEGWQKNDKSIVVDNPRVTSVMVANAKNAPRLMPKPPSSSTPPSGGK